MVKWDYLIITADENGSIIFNKSSKTVPDFLKSSNDSITFALNSLGESGWEAISSAATGDYRIVEYRVLLKRAKS